MTETGGGSRTPGEKVSGNGPGTSVAPLPFAVVQHANQYLVTDGYDIREGISRLVDGYSAVLVLHERYGVPVNLNLSGTLVETIAWHAPGFFDQVRRMWRDGLLALIGGTYAENVMPLFSHSFNTRQLNEHLWLYHHHLGCPQDEVKVCWVPERVWRTEALAPMLTSKGLTNGGYRYVLLDDRLLFPTGDSYSQSSRALFDSYGPYRLRYAGARAMIAPYRLSGTSEGPPPNCREPFFPEASRIYRIEGGRGLSIIPISANLRYLVPARFLEDWRNLEEVVRSALFCRREDSVLVYADDMEKAAGIGPWDPANLGDYEAFLGWLVSSRELLPIRLPVWLSSHPRPEQRKLEPGTYYELAEIWNAGEDYRHWAHSPAWRPYDRYLAKTRQALEEAELSGADDRLMQLAWKHLMASTYETAWHDTALAGYVPAQWQMALASHSRASLVIASAALWASDRARQPGLPCIRVIDIDEDGEEEILLQNDHMYAVISPQHGGRIVYLFSRTPTGGALVIGNPTDDWNWQQELNRYMDVPPNHPGGLVDIGFEHDHWQAANIRHGDGAACVTLVNVQPVSALSGSTKTIMLSDPVVQVCYNLLSGPGHRVGTCFSPDYYRLLREGRSGLSSYDGQIRKGFRNGDVAVWLLACDPVQAVEWSEPAQPEVGHGLNVQVRSNSPHFHLVIGCNQTTEDDCERISGRAGIALGCMGQIEPPAGEPSP